MIRGRCSCGRKLSLFGRCAACRQRAFSEQVALDWKTLGPIFDRLFFAANASDAEIAFVMDVLRDLDTLLVVA